MKPQANKASSMTQRREADKVSNEARRLSAMRMMIRGMLPELAVKREERLLTAQNRQASGSLGLVQG